MEELPTSRTKTEKAIATTQDRARTLFLDGYEIHPDTYRVGVYLVQTPNRERKGMTYRNIYEVDLAHQACDCEMFQFHGVCKHLEATEKAVTKALELAAPFLAGGTGPAASVQRENVPARAKTLSAGQQRVTGGYAASYQAPTAGNLRAQNRIETREQAVRVQRDGSQVDTATGEVLEEQRPVRVLPVYGSDGWLRQVDEEFRD